MKRIIVALVAIAMIAQVNASEEKSCHRACHHHANREARHACHESCRSAGRRVVEAPFRAAGGAVTAGSLGIIPAVEGGEAGELGGNIKEGLYNVATLGLGARYKGKANDRYEGEANDNESTNRE